jgi:CHAT domain-containing protein
MLIISSEPYIPWELASTDEDYIDQSLVDTTRPLLMGAQLMVGRWLPEGPGTPQALGRPRLPPETNARIKKIALVVGDYEATSGHRPLPKAKEEGTFLSQHYPAVWINGTEAEVNTLLDDKVTQDGKHVPVQVIHFACHGEVKPGTAYNGIVLSDKTLRLSADIIKGSRVTRSNKPFVFVNACQLGIAHAEPFADYGGLASAFLKEGCKGFIAPLWSVNDTVAYEMAVEFYTRTLDDNLPVSEAIRQLRKKFDPNDDAPPSTYIAYVFYGHPKLVLSKDY